MDLPSTHLGIQKFGPLQTVLFPFPHQSIHGHRSLRKVRLRPPPSVDDGYACAPAAVEGLPGAPSTMEAAVSYFVFAATTRGCQFLRVRHRRFSLVDPIGFSESRRTWSFGVPSAGYSYLRDTTADGGALEVLVVDRGCRHEHETTRRVIALSE